MAPVHHLGRSSDPERKGGVHWGLAEINLVEEKISYYDSLGWSAPKNALKILRDFIIRRVDHEVGERTTEKKRWVINEKGICPWQQNQVDCGVHVCLNAALLGVGRKLPSSYSQEVRMEYLFKF